MKILMVNGSPRGEKSNSMEILRLVESLLPAEADIDYINTGEKKSKVPDLNEYSTLVFAYPLYIDALPGSMLGWMEACEKDEKGRNPVLNVYALANCGFWEGKQNHIALDMVGSFCRRLGLTWKGGGGIGTGEMILGLKDVPRQAGIRRPIFNLLNDIAREIMMSGENPEPGNEIRLYTQHAFPWILYKYSGEAGWRKQARKNRIGRRAIFARPYI